MTGSRCSKAAAAAAAAAAASKDHTHIDGCLQRDEDSAPLLQPGFQRPAAATEVAIASDGSAPCPSHTLHTCSSPLGEDKVIGACRICFEQETASSQDTNNPLICPCMCSGSSKFVHRQCLQQWRQTNHRADAFYQCEVCKYRYRYQRLWWASVLGHQVTLAVMFVLVMAACIAALGFIPITDGMFAKDSSSSSGGGGFSPTPSPSPSPGPGGSGSSSSWQVHAPYAVIHLLNGVVMLGIVGLGLSLLLVCARSCGVPAVAFFPDSIYSCLWCCELNSNGAPLLGECLAASGGECCIAFGAVVAVTMLVVGIMTAAYMLYFAIWLLVQSGLNRAQSMVENVQQDRERERGWTANQEAEGCACSSSGEQHV